MHNLPAGSETEINAGDAGAPVNKYLIFVNATDTDAEVEIVLL